MDFKNGNELLALCEEHNIKISEVMRQRECELGETTLTEILLLILPENEEYSNYIHEIINDVIKMEDTENDR